MKVVRMKILLVIVSCTISVCLGVQKEASNTDSLRSRVHLFLTAWLIDREIDHAVSFFDPIAFSNPLVFSASCVGSSEGGGRKAIERRIRKFLKDFSPKQKAKVVRDLLVLNDQMFEDDFQPINSPSNDRYYLFSGTRDQWAGQEEFEYLKDRVNLSRSAICIIGIRFDRDAVGYIYTVWHKDGDSWKIIHANLFCV
jgi:hypothetical protein